MDLESESVELLEDMDYDDEAFYGEYDDDDEAFFGEYDDDDEAFDESEDAEFLGPLLGAVAGPALGAIAGPAVNAIGSLFGGGRGPKRYSPAAPGLSIGPGISRATINTPRGAASLRLPAPVVPRTEFLRVTGALRSGINRNTGRINTTQKDVHAVRQQATAATAAATAVRNDLAKYKKRVNALRRRDQLATRRALARMRREQQSQATLNLVMSMMTQQQIQDRIDDHTHGGGPVASPGDADNNFLMFLPLMMQQGGGGSNDAMMWMVMAMAMQGRD